MEEILKRIKEESKNNTENYIFPLNAQKTDIEIDNNDTNILNTDNNNVFLKPRNELILVNLLKEYSETIKKIIDSFKNIDYDSSIKDWMEFQLKIFNNSLANPKTKEIRKKRLLVYKHLNEYLLYRYETGQFDEIQNLENLTI